MTGQVVPGGGAGAASDIAHRWRPAAVIAVEGPDRAAFLQGQLTQDVRELVPGEARPTAALTPKGKLLYLGWVVGEAERILLVVEPGLGAAALAHLVRYAVFQRVGLRDASPDFVRLALYGPGTSGFPLPAPAARLPQHGEFALELVALVGAVPDLEAALEGAGSVELDQGAAEVLRVEAGRPDFGRDIGPENLPDEAGIDDAVSPTKGCYVGQEIVARRRTYGRRNRRLVGYRFPDGMVPAGSVLARAGGPDTPAVGTEAGRVTSTALSERFGPIGLGFAFHDVAEGGRLVTRDAPPRGAVVSRLPFE